MIRWGILATGVIAHKFAKTINSMGNETQLVACGSRNIEHAKAFAQEFSIPKFYDSYEALVQDDDVDAIYIATPNSMHFENMKMCIEAGKHILCEKPMTTNAEDAKKIFELAKEKGIFLMEAFWISMLPMHLKIAQIISDGVIGEVKHIRADFGFTVQGERRNRKFDASLGGGALLDIGIYNIGFVAMTLGYHPIKIQSKVHMSEFGTDDFETMIFEYENGATASMTVSIGMKIEKEGVIYGTKGSIRLPDFQQAEKMYVDFYNGTVEEINMPVDINGFEYQIREAIKCIESGKVSSSIQTPQNTISVMEIMDSIREQWENF